MNMSTLMVEDVAFASSIRKHKTGSHKFGPTTPAQVTVEGFESLGSADIMVLKTYAFPHELFRRDPRTPIKTVFGVSSFRFYMDSPDRRLPAETVREHTVRGSFDIVIISSNFLGADFLILEKLDDTYYQRVGRAEAESSLFGNDWKQMVIENCALRTWLIKCAPIVEEALTTSLLFSEIQDVRIGDSM